MSKKISDYLFYQDDWATIYCGDCLEIMPLMEPESVDLVLSDPPYNAKNIGPNCRVYEGTQMCLPDDEYKTFCLSWFNIIKVTNIIFTPGIANICNYPQPNWVLCWHKPAAVSFNCLGGYNAWEPIFVYGKPFNRLAQDYLYFNTLNFSKGPEKDHPCPKPLSLWTHLLDISRFDIVLDPFLGSGTTCLAAKFLNSKSIGIEINPKYCEIAVKRLRQEVFDFRKEVPDGKIPNLCITHE